jgi:hypothetical protein
MFLVYEFTTLNDAFAFLLEIKGLPSIKSAEIRKQRGVRACILLSWIALEDCLDVAVEKWGPKRLGPLPVPLKRRLSVVLKALKKPPIDDAQFAALRAIRNTLTHPKSGVNGPDFTMDQAESTFGFCMATIRAFFPFHIHLKT